MSSPPLLFVTNLQNSDPEEDLFLSDYLQKTFKVTVVSPAEATNALPTSKHCLIRNAWPSRFFVEEFKEMARIATLGKVRFYNPFHRSLNIEDKSYLEELYKNGYPVIPTVHSFSQIERLPLSEKYIIKPKDGGSSFGVESLTRQEISGRDLTNHLIQPEIELVDEISFYFIDDVFTYAMVSAGKEKRWELTEYIPSEKDLAWARRFVEWNKLPYGLQRIDAARTKAGELLLMEVEDTMPMLTLSDLSESRRQQVLSVFTNSLLKNLTTNNEPH